MTFIFVAFVAFTAGAALGIQMHSAWCEWRHEDVEQ